MWKNYEFEKEIISIKEYFAHKKKISENAKDYINETYVRKINTLNNTAFIAESLLSRAHELNPYAKMEMIQSTILAIKYNLEDIQNGIKTLFGIALQSDKDLSSTAKILQEKFDFDSKWALMKLKKLEDDLEKLEIEKYERRSEISNWYVDTIDDKEPIKRIKELEPKKKVREIENQY